MYLFTTLENVMIFYVALENARRIARKLVGSTVDCDWAADPGPDGSEV
jgi:hypothetical protein